MIRTDLLAIPAEVNSGDEFDTCNFCQPQANTPVFVGLTGLKFRNCNLVNCQMPEDAELTDCNNAQRIPRKRFSFNGLQI